VIHARQRGYAIVLGAFLLGALAGGGASYYWSQSAMAALLSDDRSEARDRRRLAAFTRELELSASQRSEVQAIVEKYRPEREQRARRMFTECGKPLLELKERMDAEVRRVLTKEQQPRFDALLERRRQSFWGAKPEQ